MFVTTSPRGGVPLIAHTGDFDVASNVVRTLFWRAPAVLQAFKDGKNPVFTPNADVLRDFDRGVTLGVRASDYAMTCYKILIGCTTRRSTSFRDMVRGPSCRRT